MATIHENAVSKVLFDAKTGLMIFKYEIGNGNVSDEEILTRTENAILLIAKYKPIYCLFDDRKREYVYTIDIQNSIADIFVNAIMKHRIRKLAVILPSNEMNKISTIQTQNEAFSIAKEIFPEIRQILRLFNTEEEAYNWLNIRTGISIKNADSRLNLS